MNREILFKAKRIDNGEWVEGYYFCAGGKYMILNFTEKKCELYHNMYEVQADTICQYTGLNDKDGNKIWENDIVNCGCKLIVTWNEMFAGWCLTKKGWLHNHYFGEACSPEDVEAIGNIFDNPEFLEGGAEGMTEKQEKIKTLAEDYKMVLNEAKSMGCKNIKALYNILLEDMELIVQSLEKQIPKKVKIEQWICTKCDCGFEFSKHHGDGYYSIPLENKTKYCPNCGQAIDWSEKE